MLFVQAPAFFYGNPIQVHFVEHTVECLDSPFQERRIRLVKVESLFLHQFAGFVGIGYSFLRQVRIRPAGESVFFIPCTFSVPE